MRQAIIYGTKLQRTKLHFRNTISVHILNVGTYYFEMFLLLLLCRMAELSGFQQNVGLKCGTSEDTKYFKTPSL
jgi:hypothetical protein